MTATAHDAVGVAPVPCPTAVVCDEQLLFGEAFAEELRAHGLTVVTTTDPALAVRMALREAAATVVINPEPCPDAAAAALRDIRRVQPRTRLICLSSTGGGPAHHAQEYADVVVSKRRSLRELVDAVLHVPARPIGTGRLSPDTGMIRHAAPVHRPPLAAQFLNQRERDVLRLLAAAESTQQIARTLGISVPTARGYIQSVFGKLGVHSRVEALAYAVQHSLVEL